MSNSRHIPAGMQDCSDFPRLCYVTHSKYERDWQSIPHSHPFTELAFIESGSGSFVVENVSFPVQSGDVVVIHPDKMHTEISSKTDFLEYFFLGIDNLTFDLTFNRKDAAGETPSGPVLRLGHKKERIHAFFSDMYREISLKQPGYQFMAQGMLLELLAFLTRQAHLVSRVSSPARLNRGCAGIKRYIDGYYTGKITLDYLSGRNGISKYYLVHQFHKQVGMTPIRYLNEKRLQEAKTLLCSTEMRIVDIAASVGFSSPSYFSQRFKLLVGCSPLQFRRGQTEKNGQI